MTAAAIQGGLTVPAQLLLAAIQERGGRISHADLTSMPEGNTDAYFELWNHDLVYEYVQDDVRRVWCKLPPRVKPTGVSVKKADLHARL